MNRLLSACRVTAPLQCSYSLYRPFSALRSAPSEVPPQNPSATTPRKRPHTGAKEVLSAITQHPTFAGKSASEKRYVRITGFAEHASQMDVHHFLHSRNIPFRDVVRIFGDVVGNHSVWVYDAGSERAASAAAQGFADAIAGTRLVHAKAVRAKHAGIVGGLRTYGALIPRMDERGRAVKVSNLIPNCPVRFLWAFFSTFAVVDVRLRKNKGVACVVFSSRDEAFRAVRERARLPLENQHTLIEMDMLD